MKLFIIKYVLLINCIVEFLKMLIYVLITFFIYFSRTKWKRQTAVGLELLAEAGSYANIQRMIHSSPYWSGYPTSHSHNANLISGIDSLYYRQGVSPLSSHRQLVSRMYLQGMGQIPWKNRNNHIFLYIYKTKCSIFRTLISKCSVIGWLFIEILCVAPPSCKES